MNDEFSSLIKVSGFETLNFELETLNCLKRRSEKMDTLTQQKCTACRSDAPSVSEDEVSELRQQIPEWDIVDREGVPQLQRVFEFENYPDALSFTMKVGEAAEDEGHHPAMLVEWGKVTVNWWTHKIHNLHKNDFIMAAKTNEIYSELVRE
jgi:4a-hydroxytetrahydrobiopterin dehydratase